MLRESVAPLSGNGGLVKGFMIPGTDMVNVKGKNMILYCNNGGRPAIVVKLPSRDAPHSPFAAYSTRHQQHPKHFLLPKVS